MKKIFDRYGKKEVISNIIMIGVLLLLTSALGYSYYIQHYKVESSPTSSESGTVTSPEPSDSGQSPESSPSNIATPVPTSTPLPTSTPIVINPTPNPIPSPEENVVFTNEAQVVAYFEAQEQSLTSYQNQGNDSSILNKVKSGFVSIVDFLFYNQPIGGYTFGQLTNKAKVQIIKIALSIDHKIDQYFPGYKDTIKAGYTSIKAKLVKLYLDTTALLCEKVGDATCTQAKEDFATMKKSFGFTFDLIKDAGGSLVNAIKTWYEIFRES